ncbi:SpaA isopeptide-forming pilin-related protein, partial [uncultured Parvimonas sp.]|uniref:SpaA isopeptide-forming pilin-related protein n=1 Tax=uncultured Parvimonas sp. TaxID=747372 RepID=UPI00259161E0
KLSEFKQFGRILYVKEKSVPAPYIKSNEVKEVKVEPGKTKRLKFVNKKQKAKLKLAKVGEVLKEYKDEKVTIRNKSYNVKTPIFKKSFIAGAKFDIKQNGKVIKTVISKTDFIEVELSLGKYQVEEKEAPTGFVKTSKVYDVDLTGSSEVISKSLEIENEREKVKFNLTKSFEKGMFKNETYAVFGLFTKEKENTLEKDTLIEVLEFDKENSTKEFKNTIKGKYYVKELDNSSGYRKDEKNHDVDLSKEKVATKTIINKLKRGGIKIVKLDAKNKEIKLKDVKFRLLANNKERKEIGVYTTNENGEINIENLELGEYILEEIQTKDGYILDETQRIIRVKEDNKITMETVENDFTKVEISKTDITGEKELPGAKLKVVDSEGKTVEEWETDGKPHRINKMKVGKYKLIEEIAPDGYVIANEVEFEVKATGEVQKVVMKDDTTKVKVQKVGKDDESKQLEGAEFVIEEVEETEETTDKKETESKDLSFLDEKRKFLVKKENLIEEDLEKLL